MLAKAAVAKATKAAAAAATCRRGLHVSPASLAHILLLDNINPVAGQVFHDAGHTTDVMAPMPEEELVKIIPKYDGVVVRSSTTITEAVLKAGRNLKLVGRAGAGTDNIDKPAATKAGVVVMNTPGGNTRSAAELTVSLMLNVSRKVPQGVASLKEGKWERKQHKGVELRGKTVAIVGVGAIGQEVARWCNALGMHVVGFDPALSPAAAEEAGVTLLPTLEAVWGAADIISLHVPGEGTQHMVGAEQMAAMRPGTVLINVARGGVIDTEALLEALESGHLGGAGLDVYPSEPPPASMAPLLQHPAVVCTPHLGASTDEAQVRVAVDIAQQMADALEGKSWSGVVNAPHIALAASPAAAPFVQLGTALGSLAAQISASSTSDPLVACKVQLLGGPMNGPGVSPAQAASYSQLLGAAVAKGFLPAARPGVRGEDLNLVSATFVAEEAGVAVGVEEYDHLTEYVAGAAGSAPPAPVLVRVSAITRSGASRVVSGTVEGGSPKVVQVDHWAQFPAFSPTGHVLVLNNQDKPGAVAQVTRGLADADANIAFLGVARQQQGGPALTVALTDSRLPTATLARLEAHPDVFNVATASL